MSKILNQCMKEHCFDVVYMITPSFNSNRPYFGKHVKEENVYEPTKDSINKVIERVELDRDEWLQYLADKKEWEKLQQSFKNRPTASFSDEQIMHWYDRGLLNAKPPKWKYRNEEPPKSCLILDDCLNSPAIMQSSGLSRVATLNRHIAGLPDTHVNPQGLKRSACGLAVYILAQTYRSNVSAGRLLRENVSALTLFKNKQEQQRKAILEELGNVLDEDLIDRAWKTCTDKPHGSLTIDFRPKCNKMTLRQDMNKAMIYDCEECKCDGCPICS